SSFAHGVAAMRQCVFCQIVAGEVPCHRVYASERVLAVLDIGPVARGHVLVIPRAHVVTLDALSAEDAAAIGAVRPRVGAALVKATGAPAWNVLQNNGPFAGQVVPHVHFHLIPRYGESDRFRFDWPAGTLDDAEAKALVEKITAAL